MGELSNAEIDKLKQIFERFYLNINKFTRNIYNLFVNNKIFEIDLDSNDSKNEDTYYLGIYHQYITRHYEQMKKYYLMAINCNNGDAMYNLGFYYKAIEQNYEQMKKYYLMAIDKGNTDAMNELGEYYRNGEINYEQMKKYYLMAIDKGNTVAMNNLGYYYRFKRINHKLMKKYYLMAIDCGSASAMYNMGGHYQYENKNYDKMTKYYLMAIEKGNVNAMYNLGYYYRLISRDDSKKLHNISDSDLYAYIMSIIKSNPRLCMDRMGIILFNKDDNIFIKNQIMDLFCKIIVEEYEYLYPDDFIFCVSQVIIYITENYYQLNNLNNFMEFISILYYGHGQKRKKYREYIKKILETNIKVSESFMKDIKIIYDKYIEKKYAPGGEKYKKIENDFYCIAEKQKEINI